jgi:hypothetical protein
MIRSLLLLLLLLTQTVAPTRGLALPGRGGDIIEDTRTTHDRNGRAELSRRYHHRSAPAHSTLLRALTRERRAGTRREPETPRLPTATLNGRSSGGCDGVRH